jgi:predicted RNase H-like HicB family nuclease
VSFKGTFDASFPDLRTIKEGDDRIPGRDLGELIVGGLLRRGLQASGPVNEEPFFVVPCPSDQYNYRILCYVLEPGPDPVWVVECPRLLGFMAKWRGESEENELGAVVTAIDETLKSDSRVREMRWFKELPISPFEESKYDTSPVPAS